MAIDMAIPLSYHRGIYASLFVLLALSENLASRTDYQNLSFCSDQSSEKSLACEVEEAKVKICRLESILDERIAEVDAKSNYFRDCEGKIEVLTAKINCLKSQVSSFGDDYLRSLKKITSLEEEVRLLWEASRKNNFEIYNLEHKALDAERRLEELISRVEEMTDIVSEQWIQIQQLEQAVHMAEIRTSKIRKDFWRRCKFLVTVLDVFLGTLNGILGPDFLRDGSVLAHCKSQVLQTVSNAKHYHHKLQGLVRQAMQSNEITAVLAHEEVVFFVASAVVAFPLMGAFMLLLTQFN